MAAGAAIEAIANLSTDITTLYTARTAASSSVTETAGGTEDYTSTWAGTITGTTTVTFAGGDEARYFFNAGGYIKLNPSLNDNSGRNAQWKYLLDEVGDLKLLHTTFTRTFSNQSSGYGAGGDNSPTTHLTTTGYYDLTNSSDTTMFKYTIDDAFGYGNYRANYYLVKMNPGADHADGRGNNGSVITIKQIFADDHTNAQDTSVTGDIDGTVTVGKPNTTYLNNDAIGTVTISSTSWAAS